MNNKKDKKKKKFYKKTYGQPDFGINEVMTGFLITCDKTKERDAVKEAYQILERQIETIMPEVSERLEQIIEERIENKQKQVKLLYNFDTKVNCVIFIKVNKKEFPEVDVDHISSVLMKEIHENKQLLSRYCYKMIPIKYVFPANMEDFKRHAKQLVDVYFGLERTKPWFLVFKARYTDKFTKPQILKELRQLIEPLHCEDWKEPELVFFVEINGAIMYINVLPNFNEYGEYCLRKGGRICDEDWIKITQNQGSVITQKFEERQKVKAEQKQLEKQVKVSEVEDFQKSTFHEEQEFDLL